ncbi:unnamed protein product [Larinioides sclopetarius]|uniref:Uncharacterized protein n=1 Tax=Larinioides sclopetarius TaxID=280406 RepID=A0AAV2B6A2_9ARAC
MIKVLRFCKSSISQNSDNDKKISTKVLSAKQFLKFEVNIDPKPTSSKATEAKNYPFAYRIFVSTLLNSQRLDENPKVKPLLR